MKITEYVPNRDRFGKFKPSKKGMFKTLFVLMALGSFAGNYLLAKEIWNVRCEVNGEVIGYFTRDITCNEISQAKFDSLELARINSINARNNESALSEIESNY